MKKMSNLLMVAIMSLLSGCMIGGFMHNIMSCITGDYDIIHWDLIVFLLTIITGCATILVIYVQKFREA